MRCAEYRQDTVELDDTLPAKDDAPVGGGVELPPQLLSDRQAQVLKMLYNEGMETLEIAQALRVSPQTVRSTKHQAIERLREYYCVKPRE